MMGKALTSVEVPICKGTNSVTIISDDEAVRKEPQPCIRCAKCVGVCPMGLEPYLLAKLAEVQNWERSEQEDVVSCIECGSCQFTCPAHRPLLDNIRLGKTTVMGIIIIALMPALLVSFYFFGIGSAIVCATSVAACVLFEWAINKFMLKNERTTICDGSAVLTGLLLGFNLPSNLPIWIIIIGALFAIGVGKMTFGGLGNNLFNPALVGRAALLVAFPAQMTTWPKVGQLTSYLDAETGATPLSIMKEAMERWVKSVPWRCCSVWLICFGRRLSHGIFLSASLLPSSYLQDCCIWLILFMPIPSQSFCRVV